MKMIKRETMTCITDIFLLIIMAGIAIITVVFTIALIIHLVKMI